MTWREQLREYITREARPVEKFGHQPRLYALAVRVGEGLSYDDDVLFAAVWLHDLGVFYGHRPEEPELLKRWDNTKYAMEQAPEILERFGFPSAKTPAVIETIRTHQPSAEPSSLEGILIRDADILEQLGAIGILRTVCKVGRDTRFATFTNAANALQQALQTLPPLLKLDSSREFALAKIDVLASFLRATESESLGLLL